VIRKVFGLALVWTLVLLLCFCLESWAGSPNPNYNGGYSEYLDSNNNVVTIAIASTYVFADATARDAYFTSPEADDVCYQTDTELVYIYSGSAWTAQTAPTGVGTSSTTDYFTKTGTSQFDGIQDWSGTVDEGIFLLEDDSGDFWAVAYDDMPGSGGGWDGTGNVTVTGQVTYDDDVCEDFGAGGDYQICYDSTADRLEIRDSGDTILLSLNDGAVINSSSSPGFYGYDDDAEGTDVADEYAGGWGMDLTTTTEDGEISDVVGYFQDAGENREWIRMDGSDEIAKGNRPFRLPFDIAGASDGNTLEDDDFMGHIYYMSSAGTITLPAISEYAHAGNARGMICNMSSGTINVDANASDNINLNGTTLDDGDKAASDGGGECILLWYRSADGWYGAGVAFTDGGA